MAPPSWQHSGDVSLDSAPEKPRPSVKPAPFASGAYLLALALATLAMTFGWTAWFEWSTADTSLYRLAAALVGIALGTVAGVAAVLNLHARSRSARHARKTRGHEPAAGCEL